MPTIGQLILLAIGLVGYGIATVTAVRRFRRPAESAGSLTGPLVLGLIAGAGLIAWRVAGAGTLLAVNGFDAMVLIAWLIGLEVFIVRGAGRLKGVDVFLLPVATLLQLASLLMIRLAGSGASHMHQWHIIGHAMVITLSGAFFVASGVAGAIYLIVHRAMRTKQELSILGRLPPLESLERFGRVMVAFGFPLLTFGILTGVCGIAHVPAPNRSREMMMASGTVLLWAAYGIAMLVVWLRPRLRGPRAAALATGAAALTVLNFVAYLLMRSQV
ncbi:MAG: cytochrome c biogenesis protein CcsA [Phycisphaerae bacterium]|nr:cytochrome c biogenesis protein CcsA [Phycisphaerae bacterium]